MMCNAARCVSSSTCCKSSRLLSTCLLVQQVLCKPGTVQPVTKFEASIYALTKEEGGRHTPFFTNYRPQFFFRTADVTGSVLLPETRQMVMPGDNAEVECTLISPMAVQVPASPIPSHPHNLPACPTPPLSRRPCPNERKRATVHA